MVKLRHIFTLFMSFMASLVIFSVMSASAPPGANLPSVTGETSTPLVPDSLTVPTVAVTGYGVQVDTIFIPDTLDVISFNVIGVTFTRNYTGVIRSGGES